MGAIYTFLQHHWLSIILIVSCLAAILFVYKNRDKLLHRNIQ
jgi:hypothetical protein